MIAALEYYAPHHQELRKRLIRCFLAIGLCSAIAYLFINPIADFCMIPLFKAYPDLERLVYTKLTDAFVTYLKLSLLVGISVSFPFILYQFWMFVSPGLLDDEIKLIRQVILWGSFLFTGGILFSFLVVLPKTLSFFMSYAGPNLVPMLKISIYLTFVARMLLGFGIAFEIPFLMIMVGRAGLVKPDHFQSKRKYFYIGIVVLSFLLTAGDVVATVMLAGPLFGLYEAGIIAGKVFSSSKKESSDE